MALTGQDILNSITKAPLSQKVVGLGLIVGLLTAANWYLLVDPIQQQITRQQAALRQLEDELIQKQLNVSYDEAEKLKVGGDAAQDSDSVVPQEVERVIQGVADQMAGEIQRSLDFYTATAADSHISRLYLSGGTAKIPALFKVIEQRVGVPVEILNPFKGVEIDNRRFDPNYVMDVAPSAAVAIGLALRRSNER